MPGFRCGLLLLLLASPLCAQSPIKILDARIGLPPSRVGPRDDDGRAAHVAKNNTWAPVYVTLEIVKEVKREAAIVIETTDTDDLTNTIAVPLQNLTAELPGTRLQPSELSFIPYVRAAGGDVTISIRVPVKDTSPQRWSLLSDPVKIRSPRLRDRSTYVVLSMGSILPGFTLPKEEDAEAITAGQTGKALRSGRVETATITNVNDLPDQWFGYEAVDLAVLCTGTDEKFMDTLFANPASKTRLDALLEWVRRGGKLVVSVGRNANLSLQYPALQELLPLTIQRETPSTQMAKLPIVWGLAKINSTQGPLAGKNAATFAVANLAPRADRGFRSLVPPENRRNESDRVVVAQSAFGLGRVTVVAFDLDRSPFADAGFRDQFWDLLLKEAGAAKASTGSSTAKTNMSYMSDSEDEIASNLRSYIDHFEGVPVISFGWVALFILLYTLLIGPVEYFFLKKVLKRLELTWITFPIIVLTVSTIAYFTAYAIKGNDLKLNKIDVIDIDPASNRIYGKFWLTVFSPRIDSYRIGMEPNPGWSDSATESPTSGDLIDWFGGTRSGRESIFRRSYYYHIEQPGGVSRNPYGDGLIDVPIPVWSTKAFSADWSAPLDKAAPLVVSTLTHPPADPTKVIGTFTLNLPIDSLKDVYIVYAGKAYKQENPIQPGQPVNLFLGEDDTNWLASFGTHTSHGQAETSRNRNNWRGPVEASPTSTNLVVGDLLFHEKGLEGNDSVAPRNSSVRRLDQSWRLSSRNRDEIIIVAKLATVKGAAEEVLTAKNTISPTRLWLKELPGEGKPRTPVPGMMQQDTYVRIYVPIKR